MARAYDNVEEISTEWREFEDRADLTVFQSFGWLANWQRHIGSARGTVPAIVIGSEADGEILFILQLAIYTTGPVRRLRWLGSQLCDYNAPLLARNFSARTSAERFRLAWRDVIGLLRSDPFFYFDVIDLAKMPEWIGEQRNPFMDLRVRVHPSGAYLASLGQEWDTFYASKRSAATRKRERRQLRQLADHGEVRFVNVEGAEEIALTLGTLFEQKSDAFDRMGVDNAFLQPGQREFFLAVANDPAMRDLVHVSRLDVGTQMAAISVGLKHRGCYYLILSSYTSAALSRFGPGRAQLSELLRRTASTRTVDEYAHLARVAPDQLPLIYAAALFTDSADGVATYLIQYGKAGAEDLRLALSDGQGAVRQLLFRQVPVDRQAGPVLSASAELVLAHPRAMLVVKFLGYLAWRLARNWTAVPIRETYYSDQNE